MASQVVKGNESSVAGVVLITPWDSLADVAGEKYPIFPVKWMLHDRFDICRRRIAYDGPLVIVGAQQDTLIPVAHAQRFAGEHDHAPVHAVATADHDTWMGAMTQRDWQRILEWLDAA